MAQINVDLKDYQEYDDFTPIPPGEYVVHVVDSEVKQSKSGNWMAAFTFEILGPNHVGRKLWDNFVLSNEVALRRLKSMAVATKHPNPNYLRDTEELHGRKCIVRVDIREEEGYQPQNRIKAFKALEAPDKPEMPARPQQSITQPMQKKSRPPWEAATSSPDQPPF